MNIIVVLFALLSGLAFLVYLIDIIKQKDKRGLAPLALSILVGAAVLFLLNEIINVATLFFALDFAMLFSMMPFYYTNKTIKMVAMLLLIAAAFFYATYIYGSLLYPFIQMLAIGTAFGLFHKRGFGKAFESMHKRESRSVETSRDVAHLVLGIAIFGLFIVLPFYYAVYATTILIIAGYVYSSAIGKRKKGRMFAILNAFERSEVTFGMGALYLGIGVAIILGFIHNLHFVLIGITALMFADPIATIVGINTSGPKLFYNKGKSVYGFIAFFLTVTIIGYLFIGAYSLLFGAALAFVESIKTKLDDNVDIAIAMVVVYIIFLALVNHLPALP